jgi:hypothetical protein
VDARHHVQRLEDSHHGTQLTFLWQFADLRGFEDLAPILRLDSNALCPALDGAEDAAIDRHTQHLAAGLRAVHHEQSRRGRHFQTLNHMPLEDATRRLPRRADVSPSDELYRVTTPPLLGFKPHVVPTLQL